MSKSLHTIQTIAKMGKIFSQIIFICCLIGAIGCCVGAVTLLGVNGLVIGGTNITALIVSESDIAMETMVFSCISGFIACTAECVVSKFANLYFKHELEAGTPFTLEGSREILRLGILTIAIPMGALLLEGIAYGVFQVLYPMAEQMNMEDISSIGLGVMFLVASVIFKYGSELREKDGIKQG